MGYYIYPLEVSITIEKRNFEACRKAILNAGDIQSWVTLTENNSKTLKDVLDECRWSPV